MIIVLVLVGVLVSAMLLGTAGAAGSGGMGEMGQNQNAAVHDPSRHSG